MHVLGGDKTVFQSAGATPIPAGSDLNPSVLAGARILLVEDNVLNQEVATELLRDAGLIIDVAGDGAVSLEKLRSGVRYDAVLMDMHMPVMDGLEATRQIRAMPGFAQLPIIAMTANVMEADRQRCFKAGMNDHIGKPIDPDDLLARLLHWIKRRDFSAVEPEPVPLEATPQVIAQLSGIEGLDVATGLRLSLRREPLYLSLLGKFVATQQDFRQQINAALAAADWVLAHRLAHTLKGVSAQVGAHYVRGLAETLENSLRAEDRPADESLKLQLEPVCEALEKLVADIQLHLPPPSAAFTPEIDRQKLQGICQQLAEQLADDAFAGVQWFEENRQLLQAGLGKDFIA